MPKKKQKYQNLIYVHIEEDANGEAYMLAYYDSSESPAFGDNEVGIYQFVKTAKVRTKIEVV